MRQARSIVGGTQFHNALHGYEAADAMLGAVHPDGAFDPYPRDERLRCPPRQQ